MTRSSIPVIIIWMVVIAIVVVFVIVSPVQEIHPANFKALLPPIPPEYVVFTVVATALIGSWLIPTLIDRRRARTHRKYFKECENQIGKLDKDAIDDKIIGYYVDGKISQEHRQLLNDKISQYYKKEKGS